MNEYQKLGDLLVSKGVISSLQLSIALAAQRTSNQRLGEILVERGFADECDIAQCLAEQYGYPLVRVAEVDPEPQALVCVSAEHAVSLMVLPLALKGNVLTCAISDPLDIQATDRLARLTDRRLELVISPRSELLDTIRKAYGLTETVPDGIASRTADLPKRFKNPEPKRYVAEVALFDAWDEVMERSVTLASYHDNTPHAEYLAKLTASIGRVNAKGVAAVYDRFVGGRYRWTVLQRLEGETLQHVLITRGPRSVSQAAELVAELAKGVDEVSRAGGLLEIVCPENVLITSSGPLLVPLTRPRPEYGVPDTSSGQTDPGSAAVFSLGTLLWHCVSGSNPHLRAGLESPVWRVPDSTDLSLPVALREILERCLHPDQQKRFSTPLQLSHVLRSYNWQRDMDRPPTAERSEQDRDKLLEAIAPGTMSETARAYRPFWQRWFRGKNARTAA